MAKVTRTEIVTRLVTVQFTDREMNVLVKMLGNMTTIIAKELQLFDHEEEITTSIWKTLKENN